jgi:DNA-binding NarL/FixJ family response regulator
VAIESVLKSVRAFKPNVAILNAWVLPEHAFRITREICRESPNVAVILMGLIEGTPDIMEFIEGGVSGFVQRDATLNDILCSLHAAARGEKLLPAALAESLFSHIVTKAVQTDDSVHLSEPVRFTGREKEVLDLIALGLCNKEIADKLCLSVSTVKSHVRRLLGKLGLDTRLQLAHFSHSSANAQTGHADLFHSNITVSAE